MISLSREIILVSIFFWSFSNIESGLGVSHIEKNVLFLRANSLDCESTVLGSIKVVS